MNASQIVKVTQLMYVEDILDIHEGDGDEYVIVSLSNMRAVKFYDDGTEVWIKNGILHSYGGQPSIIYPNGDRSWHLNGELVNFKAGLPDRPRPSPKQVI